MVSLRQTHVPLGYTSVRNGITKAVVCIILFVWVLHIKDPLVLIGKSGL